MTARKNQRKLVGSLKTSFYEKNKFVDKTMYDSDFRLRLTAALGGGWNFIYALFHIVAAIYFHSFWFLTLGIYYLTICAMRASALRLKSGKEKSCTCCNALKRNAVLTFALAIIFSGIVCLTIIEKRNQIYHVYVVLAMATYTFYCVVAAILNLVKLKKDKTVQKIMLRNCSMVYAIGSLFGLECVMLGTFGNAENHFTLIMEAVSGAGFYIAIILFAVNLLIFSSMYEGKMLVERRDRMRKGGNL